MKRITNSQLLKLIPRKYRDKIDINKTWWDEDEVIIVFKDGWCTDNPGQHTESFYFVESLKHMKLFKCNCDGCKAARALAKGGERK